MGTYDRNTATMFFKANPYWCDALGDCLRMTDEIDFSTALWVYGRAVDYTLGRVLFDRDRVSRSTFMLFQTLRQLPVELRRDFFAYSFNSYYIHDLGRRGLKYAFPKIGKLIEDLEKRSLEYLAKVRPAEKT